MLIKLTNEKSNTGILQSYFQDNNKYTLNISNNRREIITEQLLIAIIEQQNKVFNKIQISFKFQYRISQNHEVNTNKIFYLIEAFFVKF